MTIEEQARQLQDFSTAVTFVATHRALEEKASELEAQLQWLKKQVFGKKSEKQFELNPSQLNLGEALQSDELLKSESQEIPAHRRRPPRTEGEESKIRFDESLPKQKIVLLPEFVKGLTAGIDYEIIDTKVTVRLAQRPGAYLLLEYHRPTVKFNGELLTAPAPEPILPQSRSLADVSLLAGILVDKFQFHLPLYRQHQRMKAQGINLSRSLLTGWVQQSAELLAPVYRELIKSILQSSILLMDETPVKAGTADEGHRMKQGWYWPILGEKSEVAFIFRESRAKKEIEHILSEWKPPPGEPRILLTDGLAAYTSFVEQKGNIIHAQCWVHTRRNFIEAQEVEPELTSRLLTIIGALYSVEAEIKLKNLESEKKLAFRAQYSRTLVVEFFEELRRISASRAMLATTPFTKAVAYALEREQELSLFLEEPEVPLDTNELERQIRPIPLGRKNWLFCWTEVGAIYVGIIQSLIASCKLQAIDPYTYFVDIMQRLAFQPETPAALLIPRSWKNHFSQNPLRTDLDLPQ